MPGPTIQSAPIIRRSIGQWWALSISITTGTSGASPLHPLQRGEREAHHPRRRAGTVPAEVAQHLDQAALDQAAVPRRVLGLDRDLDRPLVVGHGLEQLAQGQHLVERLVAVRRLVVEVGPRVLPGREVERVEVGEVHRRDDAAGARRTPEVAVVDAHQVAVGGQPDVALEGLGAGVEGRDVRAEGVLGRDVAGAAVRHDLRPHARIVACLRVRCGDAARRVRPCCPRSRGRTPSTRRCRPDPACRPRGVKITCGSPSTVTPASRSRATVASMSATA